MGRWVMRFAACAAILAASMARAGINFVGGDVVATLRSDRIAAGDLDGDGRADVVAASPRERALAVHLSRAEWPYGVTWYRLGQRPQWPAIGDVDGDGTADVVCADPGADGVWVLRGLAGGRLAAPMLVPVGEQPHAVALADVDGRHGLDLIVADAAGRGRIFVALNLGVGRGFGDPQEVQQGWQADELFAVDVTRDGRPDLVTLDLTPPRAKQVVISRFRGLVDGRPQFDPQPRTVVIEGTLSHAVAAELTGDSALDLALVDQPRDATTGSILLLAGDGAGGFTPSRFSVPCPFFTYGSPCPLLGLAALDANGDRRTDLAIALVDPRYKGPEAWRDALQIFAGRGDGGFVPASVFTTLGDPLAMVSAQASDDCRPDLFLLCGRSLALQPFINASGPGGFPTGEACADGNECQSLRCTDGRCCASYCNQGERCDVPGREGTCMPPPAMRTCASDDECAAQPGQPFCADGLCCDARCADGRCDASGFEGICIPTAVEEPPRRQLAAPCLIDDECASGICDVLVGICCSRRCDTIGCGGDGHCTIADAFTRARAAEGASGCRGDCDGDGAVGVSEVVRIVAMGLGVGGLTCAADPTLDRCLSIDDVIDVVNASLSGCAAVPSDD